MASTNTPPLKQERLQTLWIKEKMKNQGVAYKVKCLECHSIYIEKTGRIWK